MKQGIIIGLALGFFLAAAFFRYDTGDCFEWLDNDQFDTHPQCYAFAWWLDHGPGVIAAEVNK